MTIEAHAPNSYCSNIMHEENTERLILFTVRFVLIYSVCNETATCLEEIFLQYVVDCLFEPTQKLIMF